MDSYAQPSDQWYIDTGIAGKRLVVPLTPSEAEGLNSLPHPARGEFGKNVHQYIDQVGRDHGAKEDKG